MKKCMALLLSLLIVGSVALPVAAATPATSNLSGEYTAVTYTVNKKNSTVAVEVNEHRDQARKVFELVNKERKTAGKPALVWVEEMYQPAMQRAAELVEDFSHTRPDGSKWSTVTPLARGENISWNRKGSAEVMTGWMNSQGHKDNILNDAFAGMAVGCVDTDNGPYWVQLFTSPAAMEQNQGTIATAPPVATPKTPATTPTTPKAPAKPSTTPTTPAKPTTATTDPVPVKKPATTPTKTATILDAAAAKKALAAEAKENTSGALTISLSGIDTISKEALAEFAAWEKANKRSIVLKVSTLDAEGKVLGQLEFPSAAYTAKVDLGATISPLSHKVTTLTTKFNRWYKNDLAVVAIGHKGQLPTPVTVSVKLDVIGTKLENLKVYAYNEKTNKLEERTGVTLRWDRSGYVHFSTKDEYTIISDGTLTTVKQTK